MKPQMNRHVSLFILACFSIAIFFASCEVAPSTAPTVTTASVSLATSDGATLSGSVNPNGSSTSAWFEYGTSSTLSSSSTTVSESIGEGTSTVNLNQSITGLSSNTTYYYRIVASNSAGMNRGSILSFETSISYNNVTGLWDLSTRTDFSNNDFTASLSLNPLNLTQTNELLPGYSDVYRLTGIFSGMYLTLQRKSNGTLYPVYNNASGSITNGGINTSMTSHNLSFYLGSSLNYYVRGVAPGYLEMWGDITVTIDMTSVFGTSDGVITLTGMWDANRR